MANNKLVPFTSNMDDNSEEAGFIFTFRCDICNEGYKTSFIPSTTYKKKGFIESLGKAANTVGALTGYSEISTVADAGQDIATRRFEGMSPQWHKEHQNAFILATNEAKGHFKRCPKCNKWICDLDWNEEMGLCTADAPREAIEVQAAMAAKMKQDIETKAQQKQVFTGEIEARATLCNKCGKPAGQGKFCNNCGAPMGLLVCNQCGAKSPMGTRFCGECGGKLC
jgi:hypothetical protein